MKDEMVYYDTKDPYDRGYEFTKQKSFTPTHHAGGDSNRLEVERSGKKPWLSLTKEKGRRFLDKFVRPALEKKYGTDFSLSLHSRTGAIIAEEISETAGKDTVKDDVGLPVEKEGTKGEEISDVTASETEE